MIRTLKGLYMAKKAYHILQYGIKEELLLNGKTDIKLTENYLIKRMG